MCLICSFGNTSTTWQDGGASSISHTKRTMIRVLPHINSSSILRAVEPPSVCNIQQCSQPYTTSAPNNLDLLFDLEIRPSVCTACICTPFVPPAVAAAATAWRCLTASACTETEDFQLVRLQKNRQHRGHYRCICASNFSPCACR